MFIDDQTSDHLDRNAVFISPSGLKEYCPITFPLHIDKQKIIYLSSSFLFQVSFLHQTSGDFLSLGLELFVEDSQMELIPFSFNRLDLKIHSVEQNDSGLYTCFINDDELSSFNLQVLSKSFFN